MIEKLETMPGTAQVRNIWVCGQRRNSFIFLVGIHFFDEEGVAGEPLKESGAARRKVHEDHLLLHLIIILQLLQESQTAFVHTAGVRLRPLLHDATARFLFDLHKVGGSSAPLGSFPCVRKRKLKLNVEANAYNLNRSKSWAITAPGRATFGSDKR